ncbi:hypothetical protein HXX76_011879 [Chlamydomonas incerta]|uniref:Peptidase M11 gametolysin domain-containing protein n=1 Tax=Chlamydomonas incerta TaxID=51695 RepID=A0A835SJK1_CHLIN|nr:hypothetical protein HXX76_011879 [Chlamydomonas incerta]|eukprot:KAG2428199.1 hypothetical protein HXX76_011879 [Chlamydomonas incerta]
MTQSCDDDAGQQSGYVLVLHAPIPTTVPTPGVSSGAASSTSWYLRLTGRAAGQLEDYVQQLQLRRTSSTAGVLGAMDILGSNVTLSCALDPTARLCVSLLSFGLVRQLNRSSFVLARPQQHSLRAVSLFVSDRSSSGRCADDVLRRIPLLKAGRTYALDDLDLASRFPTVPAQQDRSSSVAAALSSCSNGAFSLRTSDVRLRSIDCSEPGLVRVLETCDAEAFAEYADRQLQQVSDGTLAGDLAPETFRLYVLPPMPTCNWVGRAYVGGRRAWLVARELEDGDTSKDWVREEVLIKTLLLMWGMYPLPFRVLPLGAASSSVESNTQQPAQSQPVALVRIDPTWLYGGSPSPSVLYLSLRVRMPSETGADSQLPADVPPSGVVTVHEVDVGDGTSELDTWADRRVDLMSISPLQDAGSTAAGVPLDLPPELRLVVRVAAGPVDSSLGVLVTLPPPPRPSNPPPPQPPAPRAFSPLPPAASATPLYCNAESGSLKDDYWEVLMATEAARDALASSVGTGAAAAAAAVSTLFPIADVSAWGNSSTLQGLRVTYGSLSNTVASVHGAPYANSAVGARPALQLGARDRVMGVGVCCGTSSSEGEQPQQYVSGLFFNVATPKLVTTVLANVSVVGIGGTCRSNTPAAVYVPAPAGYVLAALRTAADGDAVFGVGLVWARNPSSSSAPPLPPPAVAAGPPLPPPPRTWPPNAPAPPPPTTPPSPRQAAAPPSPQPPALPPGPSPGPQSSPQVRPPAAAEDPKPPLSPAASPPPAPPAPPAPRRQPAPPPLPPVPPCYHAAAVPYPSYAPSYTLQPSSYGGAAYGASFVAAVSFATATATAITALSTTLATAPAIAIPALAATRAAAPATAISTLATTLAAAPATAITTLSNTLAAAPATAITTLSTTFETTAATAATAALATSVAIAAYAAGTSAASTASTSVTTAFAKAAIAIAAAIAAAGCAGAAQGPLLGDEEVQALIVETDAYFRSCSFGAYGMNQASVTGDVASVPCSSQYCSNPTALANAARTATTSALFSSATVRGYLLQSDLGCSWHGFSMRTSRQVFFNNNINNQAVAPQPWQILHEFLHLYGMLHAGTATRPMQADSSGSYEGDATSAMGCGACFGNPDVRQVCPNAPQMAYLGWAIAIPGGDLGSDELLPGIPHNYQLPAQHSTRASFIRLRPEWLGTQYTHNFYISFRVAGGGDLDLDKVDGGVYAGKVLLHQVAKAGDTVRKCLP